MNQQAKVVGMTFRHREDKEGVFQRLCPSGLAILVPDPDNKYDKDGTAVEVRVPHPEREGEFVHVGFLPATDKESAEVEAANIRLKQEVHDAFDAGKQVFAAILSYSYFSKDIGFNNDHDGKLQSMLLYVSDDIEEARAGYKAWINRHGKPKEDPREHGDASGQGDTHPDKGSKPDGVSSTHYTKNRKKFRRITDLLSCYEADGKEGFDRIIKWAMEQGISAVSKDDVIKTDHDGYINFEDLSDAEWKSAANEVHQKYKKCFEGTATGGTAMHEAIEAWLRAEPKDRDNDSVPDGFLNFAKKYNPEVIALETTVYDEELGIAGTFDGKMNVTFVEKKKTVKLVISVDWKSSKAVRAKHKMQAGFYTKIDGESDEGWVVAFGAQNQQGYSLNRQTREQCDVQYEKIKHLKAIQDLEG